MGCNQSAPIVRVESNDRAAKLNPVPENPKPPSDKNIQVQSPISKTNFDVRTEIASNLKKEDLTALATVNMHFFQDTRLSRLGPHLLRHVMNKNESTVIEMLKKHPELIDYRGDIAYREHQFKNINVLELALNLPDHADIAFTIYECLINNEREEVTDALYKQLGTSFLENVAKGNQNAAEKMLSLYPNLLLFSGKFTDYSGRTFYCTAYEYAYWAKDTHMCRMLEGHMDENTKAATLEKVTALDIVGLTYEQRGHVVEHSKHFDMTPLKTAMQKYINRYDAWRAASDYSAMKAAWMLVGLEQRDLPVHVINEYCRPDRSFKSLLAFKDAQLPRILTYKKTTTCLVFSLFPLVISGSSGLGVDFALTRRPAPSDQAVGMECGPNSVSIDLAAVERLDEIRIADRTQSRTNLGLIKPALENSARLA